MTDALKTSSGVEKLIERLRDEGVKAGEVEAGRAVKEAEKKAHEILEKARAEADELLSKARKDIDNEQGAAREALRIALRDSVLDLKERMTSQFRKQVKSLVEKELSEGDFLKQVILAVAGRTAPPPDQQIEIVLSQEWFGPGSGSDTGKKSEMLDPFILGVARNMLREGVELKPATRREAGIRVGIKGTEMEIDLTDQALSDLILRHLTPRYRELMEGASR